MAPIPLPAFCFLPSAATHHPAVLWARSGGWCSFKTKSSPFLPLPPSFESQFNSLIWLAVPQTAAPSYLLMSALLLNSPRGVIYKKLSLCGFFKKYHYVWPAAFEKLEKANGRKGGYPSLWKESEKETLSSYQVSESLREPFCSVLKRWMSGTHTESPHASTTEHTWAEQLFAYNILEVLRYLRYVQRRKEKKEKTKALTSSCSWHKK